MYECEAIVRYNARNNLVSLDYGVDGQTIIRSTDFDQLVDKIPPELKFTQVGPYTMGSSVAASTYGGIVSDMANCRSRSKAWVDEVRAAFLGAIPPDRSGLIDDFDTAIRLHGAESLDRAECRDAATATEMRYGDKILSGRRTVWSPFD